MKTSTVMVIIGVGLLVLGFFWGGTSYAIYPDDLGRTMSENAVWFGSWILGAIVLVVAGRVRDGEQ